MIVNYGQPDNLGAFIDENKTLWKPFHERNIKEGTMGMTGWGLASVIYPQGNNDRFSVMTWDGFSKLSDAMNYLSYSASEEGSPFQEVAEKSNMAEIMPDGFEYRIIYELVMAVGFEDSE